MISVAYLQFEHQFERFDVEIYSEWMANESMIVYVLHIEQNA